ncbi:hypothetical protein EMIT0P291_360030 [Pseudomonas sp. IT-P291]
MEDYWTVSPNERCATPERDPWLRLYRALSAASRALTLAAVVAWGKTGVLAKYMGEVNGVGVAPWPPVNYVGRTTSQVNRSRGPEKKPRQPIDQAAGSRPFCLAT